MRTVMVLAGLAVAADIRAAAPDPAARVVVTVAIAKPASVPRAALPGLFQQSIPQ